MRLCWSEAFPRLTAIEWRILEAIPESTTLREVARRSGVPKTTVHRLYREVFPRNIRVRFVPDFRELNLIPLAVGLPGEAWLKYLPPYTRSYRKAYGVGRIIKLVAAYVPPGFLDRYLSELPEPLFIVRGFEYEMWRPNPAVMFVENSGELVPVLPSLLSAYAGSELEEWGRGLECPDPIDLAILFPKFQVDAFTPLREAASLLASHGIRAPSHVLSYHFRRHVVARLWRYNSITMYCDVGVMPVKAFYLVGREAHNAARALATLPFTFSAIMERGSALVVGQYPPSYYEIIYRLLSQVDAEAPLGELVFDPSPRSLRVWWMNPLELTVDGEWAWPEAARVRVHVDA